MTDKPKIYPTYEQAKLLEALVQMYKKHPLAIADLCDGYLCPSGMLLGVVRDFALLKEPK